MKTATLFSQARTPWQKTASLVPSAKLGKYLLTVIMLAYATSPASAQLSQEVELYHWIDFPIEAPNAATGVAKWDVEGACVWTHENGATRRTSLLWYSGSQDTYVYRFGGALQGRWTGTTRSPVAALNGLSLTVTVTPSRNPKRIGWSGQRLDEPAAWAHQQGSEGKLVKCTPILVMMPGVQHWFNDLSRMRAFVAEFNDNHGFNGGHIATIGSGWFEAGPSGSLRTAPAAPDVRTFAALEAAASEWSERGGWLHLWMWGKGNKGDFSLLPGGYNGTQSRRINRYIAARLGPVPGWSMGIGWDVEFWADRTKLKWWMDDLIPQLGTWHHWIGHRYSDSDIGQGRDPDPANKGKYLSRGIIWNTLRSGSEQYAGWEHWSTMTSDSAIDAGLAAVPDRPMMSEDRFRRREGAWRQKDMYSDDDILKEIPRWATRGVAAIYGRLIDNRDGGSDIWPNKAAIKAVIESIDESSPMIPPWFPQAEPLAPPAGEVINVAKVSELFTAVDKVRRGGTILLADGHYKLPRILRLVGKRNITLRGATGDPVKVILSGKGWDSKSRGDDILHITGCQGVTIADLSFRDCRSYGIKVEVESGPRDIHIYNCRFRDIGVRAIKGSAGQDPAVRAMRGSVRYCHFENTRVPPADWLFGGDYISAIDMMALEDWTFSDNIFRNIKGRNGGGRAAIFIWVRSRSVVVERNLILNCDRGVAFGNPGKSTANIEGEPPAYVSGGVIRNNFIVGGPDCGIELWYARGVKIYHNSIWRPERNWQRGIRIGTGTSDTDIANNLVHGEIRFEGGQAQLCHNLAGHLDDYFVNPSAGNLSLTRAATEAIDKGASLPEVTEDIRRRPRDELVDLGAWEFDDER
jgi:hypothetical protein